MHYLKARSAAVVVFSILFQSVSATTSLSNTNTCVNHLPGIQNQCATATIQNTGPACCAVLLAYYNDGCFCNPLTTDLIGSSGSLVAELTDVCIGLTPSEWYMPYIRCNHYVSHTYNQGACALDDVSIDFLRAVSILDFGDATASVGTQSCFNFANFLLLIEESFMPNANATATYGFGQYAGTMMIAEYFGLVSPNVNRGLLTVVPANIPGKQMTISPDGSRIVAGIWQNISFLNNQIHPVPQSFWESQATFNGCDTLIGNLWIPDVSTLTGTLTTAGYMAQTFAQIANANYQPSGPISVCKIHTKYCTGLNAQYTSEAACIAFLTSIPVVKSPNCYANNWMSGNNVACRTKHADMAAIAPAVHCPHIGMNSIFCNEASCFQGGNGALINKTPSVAMQTYVNQANAAQLAPGATWGFPNIC